MNRMEIFFASDNNFIQPLSVAIASILCNANEDDYFNFYILDDNISNQNKQKILRLKNIKDFNIEFINIDKNLFKSCPQSQYCPQITIQTYFRYIISTLKPELEKVLYLDCDILVLSSLKELWNIDLGDNYCGAVQGLTTKQTFTQNASRIGLETTFNAGVMLINIKKWQQENISDALFQNTIKLAKENKLWLQDQDALNYTFNGNIKWINPQFNFQQTSMPDCYHPVYTKQEMEYAQNNIVILHYNSGCKPWKKTCGFYQNEYFKYLLICGYYNTYTKLQLINAGKNIFSVVNKGNYKILKILGIKFRLLRHGQLKKSLYSLANLILNNKLISNYIDNHFSFIQKHTVNAPFAIMKYDYTAKGENYYNPDNVNIGDYIQTLATKQYYIEKDVTSHIDRDGLSFYSGERVNMIMNGWFKFYEGNNMISKNINPLFISFHINNPENVTQKQLQYFKDYEPIGCRDLSTRNFLLLNGIKAYFSSCLTTTLYKNYRQKNNHRKGIIFCDYELNKENPKRIDLNILKILKKYKNEEIINTTHKYKMDSSSEERFNFAEDLLKKYAGAKLVITTRIHCALPCLALNTPVILIIPNYDKVRFDGLADLLNIIGYTKTNRFLSRVKTDKDNLVINSNKYIHYSKKLENLVNDWLNISER